MFDPNIIPSDQSDNFCHEVMSNVHKLATETSLGKKFTVDQIIEMYRIGIEAQKIDILYDLSNMICESKWM